MNKVVIAAENLSKRYVLGHKDTRRDGLRHAVDSALRNPLAWIREIKDRRRRTHEDFWALKDVSFSIDQGDSVAIIGRNGAGKSTLLKVLSRITEPTAGRIRLKGRVASLLEVGTGFHQELSGRENIFLNGAILGMSKAEIRSKFDEIVSFAEIERFLDTPVKRYSSGMYVRLAFAVAAHLEPEILIVDEVLAVGDASFQKKCLGKMGEVSQGGRTVLFVSHNIGAVQALCRKAIYMKSGAVRATGDVASVVGRYLNETGARSHRGVQEPMALGTGLSLLQFECTPNPVRSGRPLEFSMSFRAHRNLTFRSLVMLIDSAQNTRVALVNLRSAGFPRELQANQTWKITGNLAALPLVEGDYSIGLTVNAGDFHENLFELVSVTVEPVPQDEGDVPIPLVYRGVVELGNPALSSQSIP